MLSFASSLPAMLSKVILVLLAGIASMADILKELDFDLDDLYTK